jgi:GNAT superfamily N-acetyltransferase
MKFVSVYKVRSIALPILYKLMEERDSNINISHKELPTLWKHIAFVDSRPYKEWYLIKVGNDYVGDLYISKLNEIGIFILKEYQGQGIGKKAVTWVKKRNKYFLANINPQNDRAIKLFESQGFKHIQNTYRWVKNE